MILNDFRCPDGHTHERMTEAGVASVACPVCDKVADKMISAPRFKLDGCSGDFPTAADNWVNDRMRRIKQEQSKSYYDPSGD